MLHTTAVYKTEQNDYKIERSSANAILRLREGVELLKTEHSNIHVTRRKEKQIADEVSWSLPTRSWCIEIHSDTNYLKLTVEFGVTVQVTIFLSVSDEWVGGVAWRMLLTIGFSTNLLQSIFPPPPLFPLSLPCFSPLPLSPSVMWGGHRHNHGN